MNFEYYGKVLALPMKSTLKGVLRTLAYHCNPKNENFCIPGWRTINSESGVSRDVIGEAIKIATEARIIEFHHRGDIHTGKKTNQYYFIFEDIKFNRNQGKWTISKKTRIEFKERLAKAKLAVEIQNEKEGKKKRSIFSQKSTYTTAPKNPAIHTFQKSQKSYSEPSIKQGLEGYSKSPVTRQINPDSRPEVVETEVFPSTNTTTKEINIIPSNMKKLNPVLHEKDCSLEYKTEQEYFSSEPLESFLNSKNNNSQLPSKQTNDEWWEDYEKK